MDDSQAMSIDSEVNYTARRAIDLATTKKVHELIDTFFLAKM